MTYSHLKLWTRPDNYAGPNWNDWYAVLGQHRDSDALARSNWTCATKILNDLAEKIDAPEITDEGEQMSCVQEVRDSHWAVGWIETLLVHKDAPAAILEAANKIREDLEDYPALNEDHWSNLEYEEACETWEQMSVRDRAELIKESRCGASIFAARRAELPQDDSGSLLERLRG